MAPIRVRMDHTECTVSVKCEISFMLNTKLVFSSPEVGRRPAKPVESTGGMGLVASLIITRALKFSTFPLMFISFL